MSVRPNPKPKDQSISISLLREQVSHDPETGIMNG
jgi:hypothetical protein